MKKLIADEDIPRPIVEKLRSKGFDGFDVFYVEEEMKNASDQEVLNKSRELEKPLLSFDSDFQSFDDNRGIFHITKRTRYRYVVNAVTDILSHSQKTK